MKNMLNTIKKLVKNHPIIGVIPFFGLVPLIFVTMSTPWISVSLAVVAIFGALVLSSWSREKMNLSLFEERAKLQNDQEKKALWAELRSTQKELNQLREKKK